MVSARSARQRELGQNFLVDRNILDVIERLAAVSADDVVLEVGGGPGVLSERLAAALAGVHVVEIDERLRERLTEAVARFDNVSLHFADAADDRSGGAVARPDQDGRQPALRRRRDRDPHTIAELPSVRDWVVMVQREVGERFAAAPGHRRLRRPLGARPARLRGEGAAPDLAPRVPPGAQRRLGAARAAPRRGPAPSRACPRSCTAPSPTAARRWPGRWRWRRRFGPGVRERARAALVGSVIRPTSGPSGSRPAEFRELAARLDA